MTNIHDRPTNWNSMSIDDKVKWFKTKGIIVTKNPKPNAKAKVSKPKKSKAKVNITTNKAKVSTKALVKCAFHKEGCNKVYIVGSRFIDNHELGCKYRPEEEVIENNPIVEKLAYLDHLKNRAKGLNEEYIKTSKELEDLIARIEG